MRGFIRLVLLFCLFVFAVRSSEASSRQFYLDLIAAIDSAQAKARLDLNSGTWRSTIGDTELRWRIVKSTSATSSFDYQQGLLQKAQVVFADPILLTVVRAIGGQNFCVTFSVTRLDYSEGGQIEPTSQMTAQPATPDCNAQAGRAELNRLASISSDIREVFTGRLFRGMGKLGKTVQCKDQACTTTMPDIGPITRVLLLGTTNEVTLQGGADINFPSGGKITTDIGSKVKVHTLDYDVSASAAEGRLAEATINVAAGQLQAGTTLITFGSAGGFRNANIDFLKLNDQVSFSGGRLETTLGPNTVLSLVQNPSYPSQISLNRAEATFSNLNIKFTGNSREVGAKYANIKDIQVSGAELGLSPTNSLSVGPTRFGVILGCDENQESGDQCQGFSWADGRTEMVGRINALNASLRSGTFALSDGGTANLGPGKLAADVLFINTRRPGNPIRGKLTDFLADISGQSIAIDKDIKINSAQVDMVSKNLTFTDGDKFPSGDLFLKGSATGSSSETFGFVPFADAKVEFWARRKPNGPVSITDGKLRGSATVKDGGASGQVAVTLDNVVYSAGFGSATLGLDVTRASYTVQIPQKRYDSDNVNVELKPVAITLNLATPLSISNQTVVVEAGRWKVPQITWDFTLAFSLRDEELIYALAHKDLGLSEAKCSSKVKFKIDNYAISGKLHVNLGGGDRGLIVDNMNLDKGIALDPDLGSCGDVANVVCFLAGNLILGPIGGVAAGILCDKKIDQKVGELTDKVKNFTLEKVRGLHFKASL